MKDGKGPAYQRWATVYNLKQMAAALQYLQDNNLLVYEDLAAKAEKATERFHTAGGKLKNTEAAMKRNADLKAAAVTGNSACYFYSLCGGPDNPPRLNAADRPFILTVTCEYESAPFVRQQQTERVYCLMVEGNRFLFPRFLFRYRDMGAELPASFVVYFAPCDSQ